MLSQILIPVRRINLIFNSETEIFLLVIKTMTIIVIIIVSFWFVEVKKSQGEMNIFENEVLHRNIFGAMIKELKGYKDKDIKRPGMGGKKTGGICTVIQ